MRFISFFASVTFQSLFLAILLAVPNFAFSNLPPDAQKFLSQLPGKQLNLDFVVKKAINDSSSFRSIVSQLPAAKAPALQAYAPLSYTLFSTLNYGEVNPDSFGPIPRTPETQSLEVGVAKLFKTGTSLSLSVKGGMSEYEFSNPTGGVTRQEFDETSLNFSVEQSLLKNFLGSATSKSVDSGVLKSKAVKNQVINAAENWVVGIVQIYYRAWLAQQKNKLLEDSLSRKRRLARITGIKQKRGTSLETDALQIGASLSAASIDRDNNRIELEEIWRTLVLNLGLPTHWAAIDPLKIPMNLEVNLIKGVKDVCLGNNIESKVKNSAAVKASRLAKDSARLDLEAARSLHKPDLKLYFNLQSNSLNDGLSESFSETAGFDNKTWNLGLKFSWPIGQAQSEAQKITALSQNLKSQADYDTQLSSERIKWKNYCSKMKQIKLNKNKLKKILKNQKRRSGLESKRFEYGKSSMDLVLRAADDVSQAEFSLNALQVEENLLYWNLKKMTGDLKKEMGEALKL